MNFTDLDRAPAQTRDVPDSDGANAHNPQADNTGIGSVLYEYDFMPTPLSPAKVERCRLENLILTFTILIGIVFTIAALATPVATYSDPQVKIKAYALTIHGCLYPGTDQATLVSGAASECEDYSILDVFCPGFRESTGGFVATGVLTCLSGVVALFFSAFLSFGCALACKHLALVLAFIQLICLFIATITSSTILTNKRCRHTSLKIIGFKYGPAFPLVLTAFILLALSIIFYIVRRCVKPVRYHTGRAY